MTSLAAQGPPAVAFAPPLITEDDVQAVTKVLRSGWLTTGEECAALEDELSAYLGARYVVAVSSCTAALEICLASLQLPTGSLVAVPTWTFASTALSAVRAGARPLLLDVEPGDLNLSAAALEEALSREQVSAVVAVHLGGVPFSSAIRDLCASAGAPLVEDAAHAIGASESDGGKVNGTGSVAACYSFYATKNLSCGEGGAIATSDPGLDHFARSYRLHGLDHDAWARYRPGASSGYDLLHPGIKANLPDVLAALARSQLRRLDAMQARRRQAVLRYREHLTGIEGVTPLPERLVEGSADHLMMVALDPGLSRQRAQASLAEARISTSVHFRPLHTFSWLRANSALPRSGFPVADAMADRALSLPLHPGLSDTDIERVCEALATAVRLA